MATAEEKIDQCFDFIIDTAGDYKTLSIQLLQEAAASARSKSPINFDFFFNPQFMSMDANKYNPNVDLRTEFQTKYAQQLGNFQGPLSGLLSNFLNEFIPATPIHCINEVHDFLCKQIENPTALPENIVKQEWDRGRDRELIEGKRITKQVINTTANRGFSMPQPVYLQAANQAQLQVAKNISVFNSTVAIESVKIKIDFVKFAIDEMLKSRNDALSSAMNYLNLYTKGNDVALNYATGNINAYRTFYDAINSYYASIDRQNQLLLQKDVKAIEFGFQNIQMKINQRLAWDQMETSALVALAQSMGSQAAAALNGINAIVQLSAQSVS